MPSDKPLEPLTEDMKNSLKLAQKRFLFNVDVIEQKYCKKSSGLVYDLKKDKFVFDKELCTVEDDDNLVKTICRQQKSHFETAFGTSVLSSQGPAPEDNEKNGTRILKLNKLFNAMSSEGQKK